MLNEGLSIISSTGEHGKSSTSGSAILMLKTVAVICSIGSSCNSRGKRCFPDADFNVLLEQNSEKTGKEKTASLSAKLEEERSVKPSYHFQ